MIYLDAGHGGIFNGEYTTAPNKMFRFPDGTLAYEGVINRSLLSAVERKFQQHRIPYYVVSHPFLDNSLSERTDMANRHYQRWGLENALYVSLHCNAFNSDARGFEVFTSPGQTLSDSYADIYYKEVKRLFGGIIADYRYDYTDGDYDKEARFHVLTHTKMSAMLIEHGFFDNAEDLKLLRDPQMQDLFAEALLSTVKLIFLT